MRKWFHGMSIVLLTLVLVACQSEEEVSFSDSELERAIQEEFGEAEEPIYPSDVEEVEVLDISSLEIEDLTGIEAFASLKELDASYNQITDITPLLSLENLESVDLSENPIEDYGALEETGVTVVMIEEPIGRPDGPGGFLWKTENDGVTVYMLGTVHVGEEDFYPLHEKIEMAYEESDVLVPEIDINNLDLAEMMELEMELGTFQDGTTLEDHLSDELYGEVEAFFEEFGLPMEMVNDFKPWLVSNLISQLMTTELGYLYGVDEYFLTKGHQDGKEVIDLETPADQLGIFADLSMDYQVAMLEESLVDIEEYDEDLKELFSYYKAGDVEGLLGALFNEEVTPSAEEQAYIEALNDDRNYGMAEKIAGFLESGDERTYFVFVGALHYILEPHILSILEEEGYEIEHVH